VNGVGVLPEERHEFSSRNRSWKKMNSAALEI
jgi:hypothetical protein